MGYDFQAVLEAIRKARAQGLVGQPDQTNTIDPRAFIQGSSGLLRALGDAVKNQTTGVPAAPVSAPTSPLTRVAEAVTPTTGTGGDIEVPPPGPTTSDPGAQQQAIADKLRARFEPRFAGRFAWDGQLGALHAVQAHERNAERARARAAAGLPPEGDLITPPPSGDTGGGTTPGGGTDGGTGGAGGGTGGGGITTPTSLVQALPSYALTAPASSQFSLAPPTQQPTTPTVPSYTTPTYTTPSYAQPTYSDPLLQYLAGMQPMTTPTGGSLTFTPTSTTNNTLVQYDPTTGMMMLRDLASAYNQ